MAAATFYLGAVLVFYTVGISLAILWLTFLFFFRKRKGFLEFLKIITAMYGVGILSFTLNSWNH